MANVKVAILNDCHLTKIFLIITLFIQLEPVITSEGQISDAHQLLEKVELMNDTSCHETDCYNECSCDHNCIKYGDCCHHILLDYLQNSTASPELIPPTPNRWKCLPVIRERAALWIYMVSTCPAEWQGVQVALRCEKSVQLTDYTHTLDIPVFSNQSKNLYANIYCAACNNDSTILAPTQLNVICNPMTIQCQLLLRTARYLPGQLKWISGNVSISATINKFPSERKCQKYVDDCHSQTSSLETVEEKSYRKLCHMYNDPVEIPHEIFPETKGVYKNIHCAACNGVPINASQCYRLTLHLFDFETFDYPFSRPSFAIILDFGGGGNVGEESICGAGQMYDVIQASCIDYFCGKNYEMDKDGNCVLKTDSHNNTTGGGLMDSCAKILLSQSEYVYLNDSIIRVNRTNNENIFETDSFEKTENGSVLICAPETVTDNADKFSAAQGLVSSICLIISLICLAVHILVYVLLPKLRNLPGMNLLSLSCSIFVAQLLFLTVVNIAGPHVLCVAIGATTHLSFLASFFWMNVMAFDMCRTFASKSAQRSIPGQQLHIFVRYSLYAWLWPFLLVFCAVILDVTNAIPQLSPRYAEPFCWINSRMSLGIFLALPLLLLLVENTIFFTITAYTIKKATADAAVAVRGSTASERTLFFLYVKLAFIVGLAWIFGFIAAWANLEPLWYIFIILNSLQGAFIFFAFTFKRRIFYMVMDKLPKTFTKFTLAHKMKTKEPETTMTNIRGTTTTDSFTR